MSAGSSFTAPSADSTPAQLTAQESTALVLERIQAVLADPQIAAEDDFFDVGGDSILAVQVIQDLHQRTGIRLPIAYFYSAPTADELGSLLSEMADSADLGG